MKTSVAATSASAPPAPRNAPSGGRRQWLTTPQMATLLDMHPKTLLQYAKDGLVPSVYVSAMKGGRYRWRADFADRPVFLAVSQVTQ